MYQQIRAVGCSRLLSESLHFLMSQSNTVPDIEGETAAAHHHFINNPCVLQCCIYIHGRVYMQNCTQFSVRLNLSCYIFPTYTSSSSLYLFLPEGSEVRAGGNESLTEFSLEFFLLPLFSDCFSIYALIYWIVYQRKAQISIISNNV